MAINNDLYRALGPLEEERLATNFKVKIWVGVILLITAGAAMYLHSVHSTGGMVMVFIVGLIGAAWTANYLLGPVKAAFKQQVLPLLLEDIDPSLYYDDTGSIGEDEFIAADLFCRPDVFSGKDLIEGSIGETQIKFSLVNAQEKREETSTDSDGKTTTQTTYVTIFSGLFFVADFNKHFAGRTLVKSEALNFFTKLLGSPVILEDPQFNEMFTVSSTDQVEARYIMTPSLMEKFKLLHSKVGQFRACFFRGHLIMAINMPQDSFEPSMRKSLRDSEQIHKISANLKMITGLVEDLGLNVRIWGPKTGSQRQEPFAATIPL
jgi:hypothetical protein